MKKLIDLFEEHFKVQLGEGNKYVFPAKKIVGQPISSFDICIKLRMAAEIAGLEYDITHPLTETMCSNTFTVKNVEKLEIANILGHSDLRSTMRYQYLSVDHLRTR